MESYSSREWSTPVALVATGWALTVAAVAWLLLSAGAVDRLFVGVVVLVLAAASSSATIARPRLLADADGLTVRTVRGARSWPWSAVDIRLRRTVRLGRTTELLEIDTTDDQLVILGKLDLGSDPHDVAEELAELRP